MKLILIFSVVLQTLILHDNEAAKILGVFPMPSKSHTILASALLKELARKGHQVTMLSPFPTDNIPSNCSGNYTDVLWNYKDPKSEDMKTWSDPNLSGFYKLKIAIAGIPIFLEDLHRDQNLTSFLDANEKFDVCIFLVGFANSFLGICDHVNATPIGFSTVGMNVFLAHMTRNPTPYSYVPNIFMPFSDEMSYIQRTANVVAWIVSDLILHLINTPLQQHMLHKYYPRSPSLDDLLNDVSLILANGNYATDTVMPLLPNIIPIGGFHLQEQVEVFQDLLNFLNGSKHGVVYFNLGTNAKGKFINNETLQHFVNTFAKLNYDVLWKYEEDLPGISTNVRIEKWLPQKAILMHPKVMIFITHGGQGGTVEAIYGGVPMICLPHFGDQNKNCAANVANGYAIQLDMSTLNEELLTNAIHQVINDKQYKERIMLKSDLYRNQEMNPMDRAIFWVEHVIRHKGAHHLKANVANVTWYQYMLLDVSAFLGLVTLMLIGSFYCCFKLMMIMICNYKQNVAVGRM